MPANRQPTREQTMPATDSPLLLSLPSRPEMVGVAAGFAEKAAGALGLAKPEALRLTLAAEEVFSFLAAGSGPEERLELSAASGGYFVEFRVEFPARPLDLAAFNLTARLSPQKDEDLGRLGLMIASRGVDRFSILGGAQGPTGLAFRVHKAYPRSEAPPPAAEPLASFRVQPAGPQQLKETAPLLAAWSRPREHPEEFEAPGRLADMAAAGQCQALAAVDRAGRVGGAVLWRWPDAPTVQMYGPYLFNQGDNREMAEALVREFLGRVAKTDTLGVLCRYATGHLPRGWFEELGSLDYHHQGRTLPWTHYHRQLAEDPGAVVWASPQAEGFLRGEYDRLSLAREVRPARPEGEARPAHSVLGAHLEHAQLRATLRPLWDGEDAAANLADHVEVLAAEGIENLLLELDLGWAWQGAWAAPAQEQGFVPRLVLPRGGRSDLLLLQHEG
jgi:anti-sigma regulatory factor (Ser/Thr protein kinase)